MTKKNLLLFAICVFVNTIGLSQKEIHPILIKGKILSSDGKPLKMAHVHGLLDPEDYNFKKVLARTKKDGSFKIIVDANSGMVPLFFTGVHHRNTTIMVNPGFGNYELEIRLEPILIDDSAVVESILGNHNGFYPLGAIGHDKEGNGKYQFTKANFPEGMTQYHLKIESSGVKISISGPDVPYIPKSRFYNIEIDDGYASEIQGRKEILTIDKNKYPQHSTGEGGIRYQGVNGSSQLAFNEATLHTNEIVMEIATRSMVVQSSTDENKQFQVLDVQSEFKRLENLIHSAKDEKLKQVYLMEYLAIDALKQLIRSKTPGDYSRIFNASADPAIIQQLVETVPPTTSLWSIEKDRMVPWLVQILEDTPQNNMYIEQIINEHSDEYFRIAAQYGLANRYHVNGDEAGFAETIGRLLSDYPQHYFANRARQQYNLYTNLAKGQDVPDFHLTSLDDPSHIITPQSLLGRTYLIDFWATWCRGCIMAMPMVQKLHNKYKNKGFEVVNISLDNKRETIDYFREKHHPLPWLNAWEKDGFKSELVKTFEISSIPMKILVGPDGKIIELSTDLSSSLEKILNAHFNK